MTAPKYRTFDWRAVVRCDQCGCPVQVVDKWKHTQWHTVIANLIARVAALNVESNQPELPPF